MNISCILVATEMYDTILESEKKMEIFYIEIWTIWSKMEHLVQNGPTRKDQYFEKIMLVIGYMCPKKLGTKFFPLLFM